MKSRRPIAQLLVLILAIQLLTTAGRPALAADALQIGRWVYQDGHYEPETYWVPDAYGWVSHWHEGWTEYIYHAAYTHQHWQEPSTSTRCYDEEYHQHWQPGSYHTHYVDGYNHWHDTSSGPTPVSIDPEPESDETIWTFNATTEGWEEQGDATIQSGYYHWHEPYSYDHWHSGYYYTHIHPPYCETINYPGYWWPHDHPAWTETINHPGYYHDHWEVVDPGHWATRQVWIEPGWKFEATGAISVTPATYAFYVTWSTNNRGTSTLTVDGRTFRDDSLGTDHAILPNPVKSQTTYPFTLTTTDEFGQTISKSGSVTTTADLIPAYISAITVTDITSSSFKASWTTDEPATCSLYYGSTSPPTSSVGAGTLTQSFQATASGLQPGTTYYYEAHCTDQGGNTSREYPYSLQTAGVAKKLTSLTLTPASASIPVGQKQQYTLTGNYNDGTTESLTTSSAVTWSSDKPLVAAMTGSQAEAKGTGTATITARYQGTDATGSPLTLTATASLTVTPPPDTQAPSANWISPAANATHWDSLLLQMSASDNVGVVKVDFRLPDGETVSVVGSTGIYTFNLPLSGFANGLQKVVATAFDAAGNQTSVEQPFYVFHVPDPDIGINRADGRTGPDASVIYTLAPVQSAYPYYGNFSLNVTNGIDYYVRVRSSERGTVEWTNSVDPIRMSYPERFMNLNWYVSGGAWPVTEGQYEVEVEAKHPTLPISRTFQKPFSVLPWRRPVLYLPGISGSSLYQRMPDGSTNQRWVPTLDGKDADVEAVRLDANGNSVNPIYVDGPIVSVGPLFQDFGKNLFDGLSNMGYTTMTTAMPLPAGPGSIPSGTTAVGVGYDWRMPFEKHVADLDNMINQLRMATGAKKVVLAAHSMGGILSRYYLTRSSTHQEKVSQLITIGSPLRGAPKAAKVLAHGDPFLPWPASITDTVMRDVGRTLPTVYALLPSPDYFVQYDDGGLERNEGYIEDVNGYLLTPAETEAWLLGSTSDPAVASLMRKHIDWARALHIDIGGKPVGVPWTQIIGTGESTIMRLSRTQSYKRWVCYDITCTEVPAWRLEYGNGDGTVPLRGALDKGPDQILYVAGNTHPGLPGQAEIVEFFRRLLISGNGAPEAALMNQPATWSGTQYDFYSPVDVRVHDTASGKFSGRRSSGEVITEVPAVTYEVMGESQHVLIPDDGREYQIEVEGNGQGLLDVHVTRYVNGQVVSREAYNKLPVTREFRAGFKVPASRSRQDLALGAGGQTPGVLRAPDVRVEGAGLRDLTPPQTSVRLTGTSGNNGWYTSNVQVELIGTDHPGGTGVLGVWYRLPADPDYVPYRGPVMVVADGITKVLAGTTDKAGNDEPRPLLVEVKVDTRAPESTVTVQGVADNGAYTGAVQVALAATDETSGVAGMEYRVDDGPWTSYSQPFAVTGSGRHTIETRAVDKAGNQENVQVQVITIR